MSTRKTLRSKIRYFSLGLLITLITASIVGIGSSPATASLNVENYILDEAAVEMVISGNSGYVLLEDGTISKIDLSAAIGSAVTDNWATINAGSADIKPRGIVLLGANLYVASTITIIGTSSKIWISKIPLSSPNLVTSDWVEITDSNSQQIRTNVLSTDGTSLFVTYAQYAVDGDPYPADNGVKQINVSNATVSATWNNTTSGVEPANSMAIANGWIYVVNSRPNADSTNQIMCGDISQPGSLSSCVAFAGDVARSIKFVGTTAYVSLNYYGDYMLQAYDVNGGTLTADTYFVLLDFAQNYVFDGNLAYVGNYETVDLLDMAQNQSVSSPWATLVQDSDSVQILKYSNYVYSVNNRDNDDGEFTVSRIYESSPPPAAAISPLSQTITGTQGTALSTTALTSNNFSSTVTYSISPGLPAGLSFDTNTGIISGTPTGPLSSTTYTITATGTQTSTATVVLTVSAANNQVQGGGNSNSAPSGASSQVSSVPSDVLVHTGLNMALPLIASAILLVAGAALVVLGRRTSVFK